MARGKTRTVFGYLTGSKTRGKKNRALNVVTRTVRATRGTAKLGR